MTPSQVHGAPEQHAPQLLDVAWGPSLSGEQQLVIQLGRSLSSTADILQSHPLSVFFRDYSGSTQSAGKLVPLKDEDFKPNGDGKFFDGWLSTGIWGLNPAGNSNETSALDGTLWLHDVTGDNGSAWVITNAHKLDSFKEELMTKMSWESAFPLSKTPLAVQMKSSLTADEAGGMLVRIHQAVPASDETPCLFQLRAEVETQLSSDGSEQKRAVF